MKIKLWDHQLEALRRIESRDSYALFFDQGTGKSAVGVHAWVIKSRQRGKPLSALVLCPQIVVDNWRREFLMHSDIAENKITCLRGPGIIRLRDLSRVLGETGQIVITNYETLNMPKVFAGLMAFKPDMLVFDESQKCKDLSSKRTKRAIELSKNSHVRLILSGTPIVNKTFDIFSQFLMMDGGAAFGSKIKDFKQEYFIDENAHMPHHCYFPSWQPKIGALSRINQIINQHAMRVKKSECLDLPPFIRQRVEVDLVGEQARVYRDIEKDMVTQVNGSDVTADLAIKQALRLQQITSGYLVSDDKVILPLENPKISALDEVLTCIGPEHRVIIWAVFRRDYEQIRALLVKRGIAYVEATGAVTEEQKANAVKAFDASLVSEAQGTKDPQKWVGGPKVLLGHPASAGIGANLTASSYAIFYSRGFSLENDLQAEARNYRGGSDIHRTITRIDIVAKGTVDEVILEALSQKQDVAEFLIKTIKEKR